MAASREKSDIIIVNEPLKDSSAFLAEPGGFEPPSFLLDREGSNNLICPTKTTSKNAYGIACSGFLVEVGKVSSAEMETWRTDYPEAFRREYDSASGLHSDAWIER